MIATDGRKVHFTGNQSGNRRRAASDKNRFDFKSLLLEEAARQRCPERNLAVPCQADEHHAHVLLFLRERRLRLR
jgi:hypothetical protein